MPHTDQSTLFDTLTPLQVQVLESLASGLSVTAAAQQAGVHRTTVHLWTRPLPDFARALLTLREQRAERLLDSLADLADVAINTFRQILSDEQASASVRLKAAMEIVKLVEANAPRPWPPWRTPNSRKWTPTSASPKSSIPKNPLRPPAHR